jgi:hypothetical protein
MPGSGALKLSPAVVQILASLDPLPEGDKETTGKDEPRAQHGAIGTWQDLARPSYEAFKATA